MDTVTDTTIAAVIRWSETDSNVRAVTLTSTRARPDAACDRWSDYDILLVVREIEPLVTNRTWIETFGEVVVAYWDPVDAREMGFPWGGNIVQYAGALKIDFSLWPVERLTGTTSVHPELDAGFVVLLDKDGITAALPEPTYRAYLPQRPDQQRFSTVVNDFCIGVPYVAKTLLRRETMPGRWVLDYDMRFVYLLPMLEWRAAVETGWSVPMGVNGRGLQAILPPDMWSAYESTYATADVEAIWAALFTMCDVFRACAKDVAAALALRFDRVMYDRVVTHAQWMRSHAT